MLFRSEPFCTLRRFAPKNALVKPADFANPDRLEGLRSARHRDELPML